MNNKFSKFTIIVLILGLLIAGAGCKREKKKTSSTAAVKVQVKDIVEAFGVIKARDYKDINLDFPAQIIKVPVKDGQNIALGQTLIHLNIDDFKAMIKSKENELNNARYELSKLHKSLRDAEESHQKYQLQLVEKEHLYCDGVISRKELDDFRDTVKEREKAVTDIRLSVEKSSDVNGIDVQSEKVSVLDYDLQRMKNKLNQSFLQGNMIVSDYSSAVVYDISCAAGYTVGVSEKESKLLSIMNLSSLYVSAEVAEEFIKDVKLGAAVIIIPVADNGRIYRGKVIRIADMAVNQNGETNVAVEIAINHPDGFLRPNFNVDVEIKKKLP